MAPHLVRALPLAIALLTSACGGGGTDSKTQSIDGDYVLLTVDGQSLPVVVQSGLVSEFLVSARLEIRGAGARDIKQRRKSNSPTIVSDTMDLTLTRVSDRRILTRPSDTPAAEPDTATIADGLVPYALLTLRTHSAPSNPSGVRSSLVYTIQK
jgi:hypothetical protein